MKAWRQLFSFLTSSTGSRVVFLSEGRHQWTHLGPLVLAFAKRCASVTYLTSSLDDPGLDHHGDDIRAIYLGNGLARAIALRTLDADVLITSIPDLGDDLFRRSRSPVHYVYVHHSLVSTHMIYREEAFDQYDTIFCGGPHHVAETRAREHLYGLPGKTLFEYGYPRLDELRKAAKGAAQNSPSAAPHVLVAPSWGPEGLFETVGADLIGFLLEAGMRVTARPHPETRLRTPHCLEEIDRRFQDIPNFDFDQDALSDNALLCADIMISDWSGVALEFAFARERPVLFADVARKIRNPDYLKIDLEPIEVTLRERIGAVLPITDMGNVAGRVRTLLAEIPRWRQAITNARDDFVCNLDRSAEIGAARILEIMDPASAVMPPGREDA
jgi:hypothetical protein